MESENNVSCVHRITVFDKTKAIHKPDFNNLAGSMGLEMSLNVGLDSYEGLIISDAELYPVISAALDRLKSLQSTRS
jgi:hypothetical protein